MSPGERLSEALTKAARATGRLSLAVVSRRIFRSEIREAARELAEAAKIAEEVAG